MLTQQNLETHCDQRTLLDKLDGSHYGHVRKLLSRQRVYASREELNILK